MKRFWLYCGAIYYPCGGMEDFVGSFDTIDEAKGSFPKDDDYGYSWAHIFDLDIGKVILERNRSGNWVQLEE